ncbi:MAG: methylcobamide--CoM methyltransferase [Chloroflexi bacterium]|nr:methylcobamide--CoM methyltransferase [Chloroflexota bacterium]
MITTAVGNYPKPPAQPGAANLRQAIARFDEGKITLEELNRVADEVTKDVIREQVEAGLDLVTDGQIRWQDGQTYLTGGIEGFTLTGLIRYFDTNTYYRQPVAERDLKWKAPITVRDYQFAVANSAKPVKAVLTGPFTLAKLSRDAHYGDSRAFVLALARALNQEAKALAQAGAPVIQFDEPAILKAKAEFGLFQEAGRIVTDGISAKTAVYTYFGDISGLAPHFYKLPFDIIGLDFTMGPANFDLLKGFPADKELGLGIIDARNTKMETVDEIVAAVKRVSAAVPISRINLNPSCGLEFLPRKSARAKLARMVEGAKKAQEVLS